MESIGGPLLDARYGLLAGLQFHPLASVAAVSVAAALAGRKRARPRHAWVAVGVILVVWALADGWLAVDYATSSSAGSPAAWAFVATWVVVGLAAGYVLPAVTGAVVGRRVTHGTGWASAIGVAVSVSLVLGALGGGWLGRLVAAS